MNIRQRWILACCTLVLIIGMIFGLVKWLGWSTQQKFDLGNKPPNQVFTQIFHTRVPSGVFNMKVAGEAHLSGVFWMRFQAKNITDVIASMKRNSIASVTGPVDSPNALPSSPEVNKDRYSSAVGWTDALRIEKPEYYEFSTNPAGTGWAGVLVIDHKRNIIFAHGDLL